MVRHVAAWLLALMRFDAYLAAAAGTLARCTGWPGGLHSGCAVGGPAWLCQALLVRAAALPTWQPAHAIRFLGELLLGQAGLITPLIFAFCVGGIIIEGIAPDLAHA